MEIMSFLALGNDLRQLPEDHCKKEKHCIDDFTGLLTKAKAAICSCICSKTY
jgi:hypothetical protein